MCHAPPAAAGWANLLKVVFAANSQGGAQEYESSDWLGLRRTVRNGDAVVFGVVRCGEWEAHAGGWGRGVGGGVG